MSSLSVVGWLLCDSGVESRRSTQVLVHLALLPGCSVTVEWRADAVHKSWYTSLCVGTWRSMSPGGTWRSVSPPNGTLLSNVQGSPVHYHEPGDHTTGGHCRYCLKTQWQIVKHFRWHCALTPIFTQGRSPCLSDCKHTSWMKYHCLLWQ